jgi:transcriptional regulator with XRE-family HTH domain
MDNRDDVRDFLTTRRERLTPEQAGVPFFGGKRRVKGLRREEVAMLAGMSTDYYTRLERGNLTGVSQSVLEALARALQLDEAERVHLLNLADTANTSEQSAAGRPSRRSANRAGVRQGVQRILDTINAPAYARNGRTDILATNRLGRALFANACAGGATFNLARYSSSTSARRTSTANGRPSPVTASPPCGWVDEHPLPHGLTFEGLVDAYFRARRSND